MRLAAGSVLAERYRLSSSLGRGGMGEVWSAVHVVTGRRVAIKRLLVTAEQDRDGEARARFIREAQTACAVEHPNVVEILDFLETDDEQPLLVMELLSGETLADLLRRTPSLGVGQTARLLLPVVSAVGTAHARGIIHRDIKPANIYLHERMGSEPLVKVLDFGIAKWVLPQSSASDPRTKSGSTLGTPCYMAPEQAIGHRAITHRADIWALGVLFYECLAGSRPVDGENPAQVVMSLLHTGIIPIEQLVPTLPTELTVLIGRMLSRDPSGRPQDLREAFTVLSSFTTATAPQFGLPDVNLVIEAERPTETRTTPLVAWAPRTPPSVSGSADTAPAPPPTEVRAHRWRRNVTFAAVAAAMLGLLALVSSASLRRPDALDSPSATGAGPKPPAHVATRPPEPQQGSSPPVAPTVAPATPPAPAPDPSTTVATDAKAPRVTPVASSVGSARSTSVRGQATGRPNGSRCERSRQCASGLCVAFVCQ